MNPICRFAEKKAVESAVRGEAMAPSALAARHLERCPKCRKTVGGVLSIGQELSTTELDMGATGRFEDEAWNKFQHAQTVREHASPKRLALASGIAVAAAAVAALVYSIVPASQSNRNSQVAHTQRQKS